MRQVEVAAALEITQGHYSKVARRLVPIGPLLSVRIERWLAAVAPDAGSRDGDDARIAALAASIRDQFAALLSLLGARRSVGER